MIQIINENFHWSIDDLGDEGFSRAANQNRNVRTVDERLIAALYQAAANGNFKCISILFFFNKCNQTLKMVNCVVLD